MAIAVSLAGLESVALVVSAATLALVYLDTAVIVAYQAIQATLALVYQVTADIAA